MTRRDHTIVGGLVLLLALIAGAIGAPAFSPASAPSPAASLPDLGDARPYREGVLGRAVSVNPLTASSRPERDLVALLFGGLVALGPSGELVPNLASDWSVDPAGKVWTFHVRDGTRWHDGVPLTAHDVVFTIKALQDPDYAGPGGASWRDVAVSELDPRTVRFELSTPLGGFLQAAVQPIVPAHLLEGVPVDRLGDDPFGRQPIGSGPFRLVAMDDDHALLAPASSGEGEDSTGSPSPAIDPRATPAPTATPSAPRPYLDGIELRFFDDAPSLMAAYQAGELDGASGLPASEALELGKAAGSRVIRYPTTTLTAVIFNLRKSRPEFRDPRVRLALLRAIDRPAIIEAAFAGAAARADAPIPPSSWAFDPAASTPWPYDRRAAAKALADAGWKAGGGHWTAPGGTKPVTFELLSPDVATNAGTFSAAAAIALDWQGLGLDVTHRPLPPGQLVSERLRTGQFAVAVVDVNVGLDPDLYPLLASTQTTSQGLNIAGLLDPELDKRLVAARGPGPEEARKAAYRALQELLAVRQYLLPIGFRDELVVVRDTLSGPSSRLIGASADRFWDVLTWRLAVDR